MPVPKWVIEHKDLLCKLYDEQPIPLDMLPYTNEFRSIYKDFIGTTRHEVVVDYPDIWQALVALRKNLRCLPLKKKNKAQQKKEIKKKFGNGFDL